jgi:hypothetical protein
MTNRAYQIQYQKTDEQDYNSRKNLEASEPIWKTDKDWREFYIIHFE